MTSGGGVLGRDHPDSLYSEANLARDIREAGLFPESVNMLRQTLGSYQRYSATTCPTRSARPRA